MLKSSDLFLSTARVISYALLHMIRQVHTRKTQFGGINRTSKAGLGKAKFSELVILFCSQEPAPDSSHQADEKGAMVAPFISIRINTRFCQAKESTVDSSLFLNYWYSAKERVSLKGKKKDCHPFSAAVKGVLLITTGAKATHKNRSSSALKG